jgi:GTPase
LTVVETVEAALRSPHAGFLYSPDSAHRIAEAALKAEAEVLLFDRVLTPSQQRNWERLTKRSVIDRQEVILRIFSQQAVTREAQLQVELAELNYYLPRLHKAWSHLSRQRGGAGATRGEGEKQLEADRRTLLKRIHRIKKELEDVHGERALRRKQRVGSLVGSLVGYTNAGKSSLLNALAGSDVLVANRLFATLDPTTRRVELGGGATVALTDTVGFVRRLPEGIVDAFHATLQETVLGDFLIVVIDGSDPEAESHYRTTREVLSGMGAWEKPRLIVVNKSDSPSFRPPLLEEEERIVVASVRSASGLDAVRQGIRDIASRSYQRIECLLPPGRSDLAALARRTGLVHREEYDAEGIHLTAEVPAPTFRRLAPFDRYISLI